MLFVSSDCCFFASPEDFPGCPGNCIVFPKDNFPAYFDSNYPDDYYFKRAGKLLEIGVFKLDDGEGALIITFNGFSDIFWPLPWWLFSDKCPFDWGSVEDDKEEVPEIHSGEELCSASLDVETMAQATEDPLTISCEDVQGVDVPWSDIPCGILTEIAKHLKTPIDISRLRSVCKKWRFFIPPPPKSNLLSFLLPHKIFTSVAPFIDMPPPSTSLHSLVLVASTVYLLQPSNQSIGPLKTWLIAVEEVNRGKLFLRQPLRRAAISKLPDDFPMALNLSDIRVYEISREHCFRHANSKLDMFSTFNQQSFSNSHKVVLSPSNRCTSPTIDDTTALVLYDMGSLVSFRLGDEGWSSIRCGSVTKFDDIIKFNEKIYGIDRKDRAYVINCNSCSISRVVNHALGSGNGPDRQKRLVESDGELYLLLRHSPDDEIFFKVYRMNEEQSTWEEVKSLGDRILFVTPTYCFVASARYFPGWRGNCIVFPTGRLLTHSGNNNPYGRFFSRTIEELRIGVFYLDTEDGAKSIKSYPGYSDLFWPPPAWLQPVGCLSSEQNQIHLPCKHADEQVISHDMMEVVMEEGQNLENSSTSVRQEKAAESEAKPTITSPPVEASESEASTVEFQGVNVRSELVPVLQKIWDKHGNITKESEVKNSETVSRALETLAEAVVILKNTPGRLLDESQADKLHSTLSDLESMHFRVDWLVPSVEKAWECQKRKLLVEQLEDLNKTRAWIMKTKRRMAEMERKTDRKIRSVIEMMNVSRPIDLNCCIGEGLCEM